jgi:glucosylglycerate phosphorylase
MAAQAIMLSLQGVPGIYYHSLLGSENWYEGVDASGINRRINREKLDYEKLTESLKDKSSLRYRVLSAYKNLLGIRGKHSAFSPYASQKVLNLSSSLFAVERYNAVTGEKIIAVINVCDKAIELDEPMKGRDLLSSEQSGVITKLEPYQILWIVV